MAYSFEEWPKDLEPQVSGGRHGGPPRPRITVGTIDPSHLPSSGRSNRWKLGKIAAMIALMVLLAAIFLLILNSAGFK